jgi:hypothetical protein
VLDPPAADEIDALPFHAGKVQLTALVRDVVLRVIPANKKRSKKKKKVTRVSATS